MDSHVLWAVDRLCRLIDRSWFLRSQVSVLVTRGDAKRDRAWRYNLWYKVFMLTGGKYAWRRVYHWRSTPPYQVRYAHES